MPLVDEVGYPTLVVLVVLAMTVFVLLLWMQRYYARTQQIRPSWPPAPNDDISNSMQPTYSARRDDLPKADPKREVGRDESDRTLPARLDAKIGRLELLVREAERVSARLEAALVAARSAGAATDAIVEPGETVDPPFDECAESHPQSQAEALRFGNSSSFTTAPDNSSARPATARPRANRRYDEIYTLADSGLAPADIAHRLGSPVGEVELILSLRAKP